jgi:hypothetical protein
VRIPEVPFLAVAALLHAALPVMAHVIPRAEVPLLARSFRGETQIEIEVAPLPPMPELEARVDPARSAVRDRTAEVRPEARSAVRDPSASAEVGPSPSASSTSSPEAQPAPPGTGQPAAGDTFDPLPPETGADGFAVVPGLGGGRPAWALPGVLQEGPRPTAAPTAPPPPREVDRDIAGNVLRKMQGEKDKALGLDLPAAGTVASAIGAAVRGEDTPNEGKATFEVRLGPNGQVLGVRVVSSSAGPAAAWERAARAAALRLAGRTLTMSSAFAAGATVYVNVSSAMLMPDGSKTGGIRPQGAGASFDVSNLGARPSRIVKTSFRVVPVK